MYLFFNVFLLKILLKNAGRCFDLGQEHVTCVLQDVAVWIIHRGGTTVLLPVTTTDVDFPVGKKCSKMDVSFDGQLGATHKRVGCRGVELDSTAAVITAEKKHTTVT